MNGNLLKTKGHVGLIGIALGGMVSFAMPGDALGGARRVRLMPHPSDTRLDWVDRTYGSIPAAVAIAPVYETRAREVWREPVYETRRVLVEVPARVVRRRVPTLDVFGLTIGHRIVEEVIEPARQEWRIERVLVRPGRYETVYERVLVRPVMTTVVRGNVLAPPGCLLGPRHPIVQKARPNRHWMRQQFVQPDRRPRRGMTVRFGG